MGVEDGTYVSDPAYSGITIETLVNADAAAADDEKLTYLLIADAVTMADEDHPLLALALVSEVGDQQVVGERGRQYVSEPPMIWPIAQVTLIHQ